MVSRLFVVAVVCAMSAGVAAQQAQLQPRPEDAQLERTRADVRTFEIVLFRAIETAGQKLAQWARQQVPNTILEPAVDPVVNGVALPDSNLVFMVRMAELNGITVFTRGQKYFSGPAQAGAPNVTRPVAASGQADAKPPDGKPAETRVAGTTVVPDDPMKTPADPADPHTMYSDLVRFGLMDAMLDSGVVLSLRDSQWLTVVVVPIDVLVTNPLYKNPSRKLVLSIKGEDLAAFRAGKITRDEAKLKIVDTRF